MEYEIPEPKSHPDKALVIFYKVMMKNIEFDNRLWDKKNFGRCMVAAQELLEACKDYRTARRCIEDLGGQYDTKGLEWKLETIARNSIEWMAKQGGRNDRTASKRFSDYIAKQRSNNALKIEGGLVTGGEIINALGDFKIVQPENGTEGRIGHPENGTTGKRIQQTGMEKTEDRGDGEIKGSVGL